MERVRGGHFMKNSKNFSSSKCNVMYLGTKKCIFMDTRRGKIIKDIRVNQKSF